MIGNTLNPAARIVHRLTLASPALGETLFDMDSRLARRDGASVVRPRDARHLFVAGLPGGGSAELCRIAMAGGGFCRLTYRDMPFVMAPNLWARLTRNLHRPSDRGRQGEDRAGRSRAKDEATGRSDARSGAANDEVALDEVFWRIHCGAHYIRPHHLARIDVPDATIAAFRRYVGNVLVRYGQSRYLSDNANNLLRLPALREAFPGAALIVPFRHPLRHAHSLLLMHRRWQRRHRSDPFARGMARWLVRHQFGAEHRPYFDDEPVAAEATDHIDYWLRQWVRVHGVIAAQVAMQRVLPVALDRLAAEPDRFGRAFARAAGLDRADGLTMLANPGPGPDDVDTARASPVLVDVASELYGRLDVLGCRAAYSLGAGSNGHPTAEATAAR